MYRFGDVILAQVQFTDTFETKIRPALVLFEEYGNIIVMGITSNAQMQGIPLTTQEGAVKDSIIKLNYIFTITKQMIQKKLFVLSFEKKNKIRNELVKRIQ